MARPGRKTKKQPEQFQLDLTGAIGRTKLSEAERSQLRRDLRTWRFIKQALAERQA